jgi:hypothetical protein
MSASVGGHTEVVKCLCEVGGKELMMMKDRVSTCEPIYACILVQWQVWKSHTCIHTCNA